MFSKFLFCRLLKNKRTSTVAAAMENIFEEGKRVPKRIQSDKGLEFMGKEFQDLMKKYSIHHYSTYTIIKAGIAERVNRSLRNYIRRWQHERGTMRYVDHLQEIVRDYNENRVHSTIKLPPAQVTRANEKEILEKIYGAANRRRCVNPKYHVGQAIRLFLTRKTFEKEKQNFTTEIYFISEVHNISHPCLYSLINVDGEDIIGKVYGLEVTAVRRPSLFLVDKILKESNGKSLVRLKGMDKNRDEWIANEDIHTIRYD